MFSIICGRWVYCFINGYIYVSVSVVIDNRMVIVFSVSISKNEISISMINSVCVFFFVIVLLGSGWFVVCLI